MNLFLKWKAEKSKLIQSYKQRMEPFVFLPTVNQEIVVSFEPCFVFVSLFVAWFGEAR